MNDALINFRSVGAAVAEKRGRGEVVHLVPARHRQSESAYEHVAEIRTATFVKHQQKPVKQ